MTQKFTLGELARRLDGILIGDAAVEIHGVAPVHSAREDEITFLLDVGDAKRLERCRAAALLVPAGSESTFAHRAVIAVERVGERFEEIAAMFRPARRRMILGISPDAKISDRAQFGANVSVGAGAYIGSDVVLGDDCVIFPNVVILDGTRLGDGCTVFPNGTIYENCVIGKDCVIHSGAVIGAYGFGYESSGEGHRLSAQLGNVVLEDEVEVGACSTIDRGTHGSTRIGRGTKIDNLVMVGHNCELGKYNLICAHTGIAGSTTTGDFVVMAGRVGVRDHVHIGGGAVLGAMAGIMGNIPENGRFVGIPATPEKEQMKKQVALAKLPEMRREFIALQAEVRRLTEKLAELENGKANAEVE